MVSSTQITAPTIASTCKTAGTVTSFSSCDRNHRRPQIRRYNASLMKLARARRIYIIYNLFSLDIAQTLYLSKLYGLFLVSSKIIFECSMQKMPSFKVSIPRKIVSINSLIKSYGNFLYIYIYCTCLWYITERMSKILQY